MEFIIRDSRGPQACSPSPPAPLPQGERGEREGHSLGIFLSSPLGISPPSPLAGEGLGVRGHPATVSVSRTVSCLAARRPGKLLCRFSDSHSRSGDGLYRSTLCGFPDWDAFCAGGKRESL